jgi:hypothetical protein
MTLQYCCALPNSEASLRQYNGAESIVPSLVLTQRFIYVRGGGGQCCGGEPDPQHFGK